MAIADTAVLLAKLGGVTPAAPTDPKWVARRTSELMADLVEPAKADALDKLGEAERALTIATGWLRMRTTTKMHLGASAAAEER